MQERTREVIGGIRGFRELREGHVVPRSGTELYARAHLVENALQFTVHVRGHQTIAFRPVGILGGRRPLDEAEAAAGVARIQALPDSGVDGAFRLHVSEHPANGVLRPAAAAQIVQNVLRVHGHLALRQIAVAAIGSTPAGATGRISAGVAEEVLPQVARDCAVRRDTHVRLEGLCSGRGTSAEVAVNREGFELRHKKLRGPARHVVGAVLHRQTRYEFHESVLASLTICGKAVGLLIILYSSLGTGAEDAVRSKGGVVVPVIQQALESAHVLTGAAGLYNRPARECDCHNFYLLSLEFLYETVLKRRAPLLNGFCRLERTICLPGA